MRWAALSVAIAITTTLSPSHAHEFTRMRPSDYDACGVWNTHVQDLVDQNRISTETSDEQFDTALRLFAEARNACSSGRFRDAFHLYCIIPLQRPQRTALR